MTMPDHDDGLRARVYAEIAALAEGRVVVGETTALLGDARVLDSMKLVELCLALEDIAGEAGFRFDWTSDAAMSRSRGMFRSAGALAAEFLAQRAACRTAAACD